MAQTFDLSVLFKLINKTSTPLQDIKKSFGVVGTAIANASIKLKKFGRGMQSAGENLSLRLGAPLLLLGRQVTKTALDFESAFTGVRKTVNATEPEFKKLEQGFKRLSTEIPVSAVALFGIGEAAGQLGIEKANILGFSKVMADLGATTNLQGDEAAKALARLANITGMPQDQFDRLGSTIVDLGNNLATTESEIVNMALRIAGAGKVAGLSEADILSFAGALSSIGIPAEAGGTAISRVMLDIEKAVSGGSKKSRKHLRIFSKATGKNAKDFKKAWREDAQSTLIDFIEGLARMEKEVEGRSVKALDKLGLDGARVARVLLGAAGAGDKFRKATERGNTAWKSNNALTKEANLRYGTAASKLIIFKNKVALLAEEFGKALIPKLLEFTESLESMIEDMKEWDDNTKNLVITIGGLTAAITLLMIPLGMLITAAGTVGGAFVKIGVILSKIWVWIAGFGLIVGSAFALFAGLIIGVITLYTKWDKISDGIAKKWRQFKKIVDGVWGVISKVSKALFFMPSTIASQISFGKTYDKPAELTKTSLIDTSLSKTSVTDVNIRLAAGLEIEKVKSKGGGNVNVISDYHLGTNMSLAGGY